MSSRFAATYRRKIKYSVRTFRTIIFFSSICQHDSVHSSGPPHESPQLAVLTRNRASSGTRTVCPPPCTFGAQHAQTADDRHRFDSPGLGVSKNSGSRTARTTSAPRKETMTCSGCSQRTFGTPVSGRSGWESNLQDFYNLTTRRDGSSVSLSAFEVRFSSAAMQRGESEMRSPQSLFFNSVDLSRFLLSEIRVFSPDDVRRA
jgi:hypothetical protein